MACTEYVELLLLQRHEGLVRLHETFVTLSCLQFNFALHCIDSCMNVCFCKFQCVVILFRRPFDECEYKGTELLQVVHVLSARFLQFLVSFLSPQSSGLTTTFLAM